ncbi:MAG: DNA polymerase III subunit delta' [Nitrospira sp.]|nr:DNA polymerase III subunit delta' [Nitrospira sp.]
MALRDIIGQDKAVTILLRTIQRGRIPSSYLFAGEPGIGKKFTAINLAKALNCQSREQRSQGIELNNNELTTQIDACEECPSCKKIDTGSHPDFLFISPKSGLIRIEEIRAIDDALSFKPFEGRKKVVIIDEADTMNPYAANAFLKTLEEPPEDSLIILISSSPDRLPDTIRSRCSKINFTPLPVEACEKVIKTVMSQKAGKPASVQAKKSKKPVKDDSQLSTLVRLSMGRPGLAISGDLIEERTWFIQLLQGMLNTEKDGWTSKEEMEKWFDLLLVLLRDAAILKITRDTKNLINSDIKDSVKKLSSSMDLKGIIENYQNLNTLKVYFNFNLNKSLTWNYTGSILRRFKNEKF